MIVQEPLQYEELNTELISMIDEIGGIDRNMGSGPFQRGQYSFDDYESSEPILNCLIRG
jgi:hypothetical protein